MIDGESNGRVRDTSTRASKAAPAALIADVAASSATRTIDAWVLAYELMDFWLHEYVFCV